MVYACRRFIVTWYDVYDDGGLFFVAELVLWVTSVLENVRNLERRENYRFWINFSDLADWKEKLIYVFSMKINYREGNL